MSTFPQNKWSEKELLLLLLNGINTFYLVTLTNENTRGNSLIRVVYNNLWKLQSIIWKVFLDNHYKIIDQSIKGGWYTIFIYINW